MKRATAIAGIIILAGANLVFAASPEELRGNLELKPVNCKSITQHGIQPGGEAAAPALPADNSKALALNNAESVPATAYDLSKLEALKINRDTDDTIVLRGTVTDQYITPVRIIYDDGPQNSTYGLFFIHWGYSHSLAVLMTRAEVAHLKIALERITRNPFAHPLYRFMLAKAAKCLNAGLGSGKTANPQLAKDAFEGLDACSIVDAMFSKRPTLRDAQEMLIPCIRAVSKKYNVLVSPAIKTDPQPSIDIYIMSLMPPGNTALVDLEYSISRRGGYLLTYPARAEYLGDLISAN